MTENPKKKLSGLLRVAEMAFECEVAELRRFGSQEAALRAEIQAIDQPFAHRTDDNLIAHQTVAERHAAWRRQRRATVQRSLAICRAETEEKRATARKVFARVHAVKALIQKARSEDIRVRRRLHETISPD